MCKHYQTYRLEYRDFFWKDTENECHTSWQNGYVVSDSKEFMLEILKEKKLNPNKKNREYRIIEVIENYIY
jgi:hypothetical protein